MVSELLENLSIVPVKLDDGVLEEKLEAGSSILLRLVRFNRREEVMGRYELKLEILVWFEELNDDALGGELGVEAEGLI